MKEKKWWDGKPHIIPMGKHQFGAKTWPNMTISAATPELVYQEWMKSARAHRRCTNSY